MMTCLVPFAWAANVAINSWAFSSDILVASNSITTSPINSAASNLGRMPSPSSA
jgi:hypothetical protein